MTIYATPPWDGSHTFPHKRITRKVAKATRAYSCEMQGERPEGHVRTIETGAEYLRVAIRPPRHGSGGWVAVHLCPACAVSFGLASEEPPTPQLRRLRT